MINLNKQNIYRFFDLNHKVFLETPREWMDQNDNGKKDSLFRTSLSYISYGKKNLYGYPNIIQKGILSCFRKYKLINKKKWYYQPMRYPLCEYGDDTSRDQVIMALVSLKINNDKEILKDISLNLPYKLSRRFSMTPELWLWIRVLTLNKYKWLFYLLFNISILISLIWGKFIDLLLGLNKKYTINELLRPTPEGNFSKTLFIKYKKKLKNNPMYRFLDSLRYPMYSVHLSSWMIYILQDNIYKKFSQWLLSFWITDENLLLMLLNNKNVDIKKIDNYHPMYNFIWSNRFDGTDWIEILEGDSSLYNTIDKDILYVINKYNND
jgi:hypothetical protein